MENFITSTPVGTEGFNISYSDEKYCAEALLKKLPAGWKVDFNWAQILFSDVQYHFDAEKKIVFVTYNQNLRHWWKSLQSECLKKIKVELNKKVEE